MSQVSSQPFAIERQRDLKEMGHGGRKVTGVMPWKVFLGSFPLQFASQLPGSEQLHLHMHVYQTPNATVHVCI